MTLRRRRARRAHPPVQQPRRSCFNAARRQHGRRLPRPLERGSAKRQRRSIPALVRLHGRKAAVALPRRAQPRPSSSAQSCAARPDDGVTRDVGMAPAAAEVDSGVRPGPAPPPPNAALRSAAPAVACAACWAAAAAFAAAAVHAATAASSRSSVAKEGFLVHLSAPSSALELFGQALLLASRARPPRLRRRALRVSVGQRQGQAEQTKTAAPSRAQRSARDDKQLRSSETSAPMGLG